MFLLVASKKRKAFWGAPRLLNFGCISKKKLYATHLILMQIESGDKINKTDIFRMLLVIIVLGVVGASCKSYVPPPAELSELFGDKLVKSDGSTVLLDDLAGKTVGMYFSAHWCPPCRQFTPMLVKTYNDLKVAGKEFEIVLVSWDDTENEMFAYMNETKMPWMAMPFNRDMEKALKGRYRVRGIPTLVIIDKDGNFISKSAVGDVVSNGAAAFDQW